MNKPTIYTIKVAKIDTLLNSRVTNPAQCEHSIILDDLISVGPIVTSDYSNSATLMLTYNRQHNPTQVIHFPRASASFEARQKLVADWMFFTENGSVPQEHNLGPESLEAHPHQDVSV